MPGRIIPGRTVGERPQLPRAGSGAGAWCETWLCPGGQPAAVNPSKGCPVNDLQSAARFGGTAPSCALLVAAAPSDEPWEVRIDRHSPRRGQTAATWPPVPPRQDAGEAAAFL